MKKDLESIVKIQLDNKEIFLLGTAHISKKSAEEVKKAINYLEPDCVAIELDQKRYDSIVNKNRWENLNIKEVIKNKELPTLFINLLLAAFQKKLAKKLEVTPGIEFIEAINEANSKNIKIVLADRDIRITLKRAWSSISFWQKMTLISSIFAGFSENDDLTEEKLENMKNSDVISELMNELGKEQPILKKVLVDERDIYLAEKIKLSDGKKVLGIIGAGHLQGIIKVIENNKRNDLYEIEKIPESGNFIKVIGWLIPIIIVGSIFAIGYLKGLNEAADNLIFWILANGIPSAIGAIIALAHPLTIVISFIAAPITSLTPVIGVGIVAAFFQAFFSPPLVSEIQNSIDDISNIKFWWKNKLLKIILVFILTTIGSALGTYAGLYEIIGNLIK